MIHSPARLALIAGLALVVLAGCAPVPTKPDPRDPLERMNRATYKFNDALDRAVAKPVAQGYRKVTPQVVQTGVSNFFSNLDGPTVVINDALQAKPKSALRDLARFVMNTVVGLGGIMDPASDAGLEAGDEDFGQTLGRWGVGPGPFIVLPILGPSDVRDALGKVPDDYTDPAHYLKSSTDRWVLRGGKLVDKRARLLDAEGMLDRTYDRYAFVKNAYLQRRQYLVKDGKIDEAPADEGLEQEMKDEDSSDQGASPAASGAAPAAAPAAAPTATPAAPSRPSPSPAPSPSSAPAPAPAPAPPAAPKPDASHDDLTLGD